MASIFKIKLTIRRERKDEKKEYFITCFCFNIGVIGD